MDVSPAAGKSVDKPRFSKPIVAAGFPPSPPVITAPPPPTTIGKSVAAAPSVPPRNGSRLEHATTTSTAPRLAEKYFDTNIEASPPPPAVKKAAVTGGGGVNDPSNCDTTTVRGGGGGNEAVVGRDMADRGRGGGVGGNNYRDSWKARQEAQNTLVFNFINSKKDVSHIENDGLDLTKRTAATNKVKSGNILIIHSFFLLLISRALECFSRCGTRSSCFF